MVELIDGQVLVAEAKPPIPIKKPGAATSETHVSANIEAINERQTGECITQWETALFDQCVNGVDSSKQYQKTKRTLTRISPHVDPTSRDTLTQLNDVLTTPVPKTDVAQLPKNAEGFYLHDKSKGRNRYISAFQDQLGGKISELVSRENKQILEAKPGNHIKQIDSCIRFAPRAKKLYSDFSQRHTDTMHKIVDRMKYLGLNKNLVVEGENSDLLLHLVKSADFGGLTVEDRGKTYRSAEKNKITTGNAPEIQAINSAVKDANGDKLPPIQDPELIALIKNLTSDPEITALKQEYADSPAVLNMIDWTLSQTVSREFLPKEATAPVREIDMSRLKKVKDLGEDQGETFQSSNPISLWIDSDTNRKFIVKQCPEQTLQADYFGLEMIQMVGVPVYEFYFGYIPPAKEGESPKRVLVSGFLEGFEDPSNLIEDTPDMTATMKKMQLPENLQDSPYIKRAMLMELFIGEYNSKAHNFMALGESVQHLDQGACLNSTASGKFKGFGEEITVEDVRDVLHCYTDWDHNREEPINQAYAQIAEVIQGKLVIHDLAEAKQQLQHFQAVPPEKFNDALRNAGYKDGAESIGRLNSWIQRINTELLPGYEAKALKETQENGHPSKRTEQYIRWAKEARTNFTTAIQAGGELSYYTKTLEKRRASLISLWQTAISEAEAAQK